MPAGAGAIWRNGPSVGTYRAGRGNPWIGPREHQARRLATRRAEISARSVLSALGALATRERAVLPADGAREARRARSRVARTIALPGIIAGLRGTSMPTTSHCGQAVRGAAPASGICKCNARARPRPGGRKEPAGLVAGMGSAWRRASDVARVRYVGMARCVA